MYSGILFFFVILKESIYFLGYKMLHDPLKFDLNVLKSLYKHNVGIETYS